MSASSSPSAGNEQTAGVTPDDEAPRSFLESRAWFGVFAVAGVAVAIAAFVLLTRADSADRGFAYTVLDPPQSTLDFTLRNHRGENFTLSDHAGETTILTFLYTSCTDVCPFIGAKLRQTLDILGDEAEGVNVVAITVDPARDTAERVSDYSRSLRMYNDWDYLLGDEETLAPIWEKYFVGMPVITAHAVFATDEEINEYGLNHGLTDLNERTANAARFEFGGGYDVGHPTPVLIIDGAQTMRILAGQDLDPVQFAADVLAISNENS